MTRLRGLLGTTGAAVVATVPRDFDLGKELLRAEKVLLATAFARTSGWGLIERDLLSSPSELKLLTGLDFLQTEPDLLREWLRLTKRYDRVGAKIASRVSIFHPKVLIVKVNARSASFAIVGSGNLTDGGLRTNTECGLYTNDSASVLALERWFEECWKRGTKLRARAIEQYEPRYKKARKALQEIRRNQNQVQTGIARISAEEDSKEKAKLKYLDKAVSEFRRYSGTEAFKSQYEGRLRAVKRFKALLDVPQFDFNNDDFTEFYKAPALGGLREGWLAGILEQAARLKKGLRYLTDEGQPVDERINSFLVKNGRYHIRGFGIAAVSKVLALAYPRKHPVLNGAVNDALNFFGYEVQRGLSTGEKYHEFTRLADKFRQRAGAPDFIAMDAFFKYWEGKIKHRTI